MDGIRLPHSCTALSLPRCRTSTLGKFNAATLAMHNLIAMLSLITSGMDSCDFTGARTYTRLGPCVARAEMNTHKSNCPMRSASGL